MAQSAVKTEQPDTVMQEQPGAATTKDQLDDIDEHNLKAYSWLKAHLSSTGGSSTLKTILDHHGGEALAEPLLHVVRSNILSHVAQNWETFNSTTGEDGTVTIHLREGISAVPAEGLTVKPQGTTSVFLHKDHLTALRTSQITPTEWAASLTKHKGLLYAPAVAGINTAHSIQAVQAYVAQTTESEMFPPFSPGEAPIYDSVQEYLNAVRIAASSPTSSFHWPDTSLNMYMALVSGLHYLHPGGSLWIENRRPPPQNMADRMPYWHGTMPTRVPPICVHGLQPTFGAGLDALTFAFGVPVPGVYVAKHLETAMHYPLSPETRSPPHPTDTNGVSGGQIVAGDGTLPLRATLRIMADPREQIFHRSNQSAFMARNDDNGDPTLYISHIILWAVPPELCIDYYRDVVQLNAKISPHEECTIRGWTMSKDDLYEHNQAKVEPGSVSFAPASKRFEELAADTWEHEKTPCVPDSPAHTVVAFNPISTKDINTTGEELIKHFTERVGVFHPQAADEPSDFYSLTHYNRFMDATFYSYKAFLQQRINQRIWRQYTGNWDHTMHNDLRELLIDFSAPGMEKYGFCAMHLAYREVTNDAIAPGLHFLNAERLTIRHVLQMLKEQKPVVIDTNKTVVERLRNMQTEVASKKQKTSGGGEPSSAEPPPESSALQDPTPHLRWQVELDGTWTRFEKEISVALNDVLHRHNSDNSVSPIYEWKFSRKNRYQIDVVKLTQTNVKFGTVRPIKQVATPIQPCMPPPPGREPASSSAHAPKAVPITKAAPSTSEQYPKVYVDPQGIIHNAMATSKSGMPSSKKRARSTESHGSVTLTPRNPADTIPQPKVQVAGSVMLTQPSENTRKQRAKKSDLSDYERRHQQQCQQATRWGRYGVAAIIDMPRDYYGINRGRYLVPSTNFRIEPDSDWTLPTGENQEVTGSEPSSIIKAKVEAALHQEFVELAQSKVFPTEPSSADVEEASASTDAPPVAQMGEMLTSALPRVQNLKRRKDVQTGTIGQVQQVASSIDTSSWGAQYLAKYLKDDETWDAIAENVGLVVAAVPATQAALKAKLNTYSQSPSFVKAVDAVINKVSTDTTQNSMMDSSSDEDDRPENAFSWVSRRTQKLDKSTALISRVQAAPREGTAMMSTANDFTPGQSVSKDTIKTPFHRDLTGNEDAADLPTAEVKIANDTPAAVRTTMQAGDWVETRSAPLVDPQQMLIRTIYESIAATEGKSINTTRLASVVRWNDDKVWRETWSKFGTITKFLCAYPEQFTVTDNEVTITGRNATAQ